MGKPRTAGASRAASKATGGDNAKEYNTHFQHQYGSERWNNSLKGALLEPSQLLALQNNFTQQELAADGLEPWLQRDGCSTFRRTQLTGPYPPPGVDGKTGLAGWYWLDAASLLPPLLLGVEPGMSVLDMCASPGGKSLVIAQQLWRQPQNAGSAASAAASKAQGLAAEAGHSGASSSVPDAAGHAPAAPSHARAPVLSASSSLTCNEPDAKRRLRLQQVLQEYLPTPLMNKVRITAQEGDKYWQRCESETYDRVLIDAPCSSDRHILQQSVVNRGAIPEAHWSVKRCKKASDLQLQLLLAGLKALKVGGNLVYATCSMSALENDEVIHRALARVGQANVQIQKMEDGYPLEQEYLEKLGVEKTHYGVIALPDTQGWGPIYACVLRKCSSIAKTTIPMSVLTADSESESESS